MRYFLDTSVIMYAAGATHEYKESCVKILERIEHQSLEVFTSTEVIQELLYRYAHLHRKEDGIALARSVMSFVPILPVDEAVIESAIELLQRYDVDPRDTLHAAVALNFGIASIISADQHFDRINEIKRIDPLTFE